MGILSQSTKGVVKRKPIIMIYGPPKIGKTTLVSQMPKPTVIDADQGSENVNVDRDTVTTFDQIPNLLNQAVKSPFETIAIDTLDMVEMILHSDICKDEGKKSIMECYGGYGKALPIILKDFYMPLQAQLRAIQAADKYVVLVCHDVVSKYKDPRTDNDYDKHRPKLNDSASGSSVKFWLDFVDVCLFVNRKPLSIGDKGRVFDDGQVKAYTQGRAQFDAGSRYQIPFELPFDWPSIKAALEGKERNEAQVRQAIIEAAAGLVEGDIKATFRKRFETAKSLSELLVIETNLKDILSTQGA